MLELLRMSCKRTKENRVDQQIKVKNAAVESPAMSIRELPLSDRCWSWSSGHLEVVSQSIFTLHAFLHGIWRILWKVSPVWPQRKEFPILYRTVRFHWIFLHISYLKQGPYFPTASSFTHNRHSIKICLMYECIEFPLRCYPNLFQWSSFHFYCHSEFTAPLAAITYTLWEHVVFSVFACVINFHVIIYYICNRLSCTCFGNHRLFPIKNKPLLTILVYTEVTFTIWSFHA